MSAKKSFRVRFGNSSVLVYRWRAGWRFSVRDDTGRRRYVSASTEKFIRGKAMDHLTTQGGVPWSALTVARQAFLLGLHALIPAGHESAVLDYLQGRASSLRTVDALAAFGAAMGARSVSTIHVRKTLSILERVVVDHAGFMADITTAELSRRLAVVAGSSGTHQRGHMRVACVQFWNWAKNHGYVPNESRTAADRLPTVRKAKGEKVILTRLELESILAACPSKHLVVLLLGAFAGLRPEEIAPGPEKRRDGRRGLHWEDIDFEFNVIRVAAETSKVGNVRLVPLLPVLREQLAPLRGVGAVSLSNPARDETLKKLGDLLPGGLWPRDALRHSFGSYRNAVLRNLPQVAEEMGTSVDILQRHYHNPQPKEIGVEWFSSLGMFRKCSAQ